MLLVSALYLPASGFIHVSPSPPLSTLFLLGVHCSWGYSFFSQNEEDSVSCSNPLSRLALESDLGSDANGVRDGD